MIKPNDQNLINFLEDFHIGDSRQIRELYFPKTSFQYACNRLKYLTDQGHLKRCRSTISSGYAYYVDKKPQQIHHDLIRVELFVNLHKLYKVLEWKNESPVGHTRPDAMAFVGSDFAYIENHGIVFPVFVEIHLNNNFNFDKYIKLQQDVDLRTIYGLFPRVIICTDQKIAVPNINIKFKIVRLDMKGLDTIFK